MRKRQVIQQQRKRIPLQKQQSSIQVTFKNIFKMEEVSRESLHTFDTKKFNE